MKVVCAWCGFVINKGLGRPDERVSHGLCKKCHAIVTASWGVR